MSMSDDDLKALQKQAIDTIKLAQGKMEFLSSHGLVNPLAVMQNAIECLVDYMIPKHLEAGGDPNGVPTNPERLRFDIYHNQRIIANCDQAMGQTSGGLHVVKGDGNGRN